MKAMESKLKTAEAGKTDATKRMKAATEAAKPTDTVDIVFSEPVHIVIKPADKK